MVKVGVTGGIGSGKSTVCSELEKLGAVVVYADDLAKELMVEDAALAGRIRTIFGEQAFLDDGTLNRKFLAREAFQKGRVDQLNRLVHPVVREKVKELMERAEAQGTEMFVEEAALLLAGGRPAGFDYIVLVTAEKEKRVEWVSRRDKVSREDVLLRMDRQIDFEEVSHLCDFVIENSAGLVGLKHKAGDLYRQILNLQNCGVD